MAQGHYKTYLEMVRNGKALTLRQQIILIAALSFPSILAQISSVIMGYIDASMVGRLGSGEAAAIGLVSTSTWLLGSIVYASVTGFTVQAAQAIGAKKEHEAREILRQSLRAIVVVALLLLLIGAAVSPYLPHWLGGTEQISGQASMYFLIYSLALPAMGLNALAGGMLQSSGNMKIPGILNSLMCLLDIIFNYFFIFPTRDYDFAGVTMVIPGFNMGVAGAALGTALAEVVTACLMLSFLMFKSNLGVSRIGKDEYMKGQAKSDSSEHIDIRSEFTDIVQGRNYMKKAWVIAAPVAFEHFVVCFAMVITTRIIAPLGVVAIAANSFAITAESLCYMPGYGISDAATTLVGQSVGAGRKELARQFARRTTYIGLIVTVIGSIIMYIMAPFMIGILTNDPQVLELGTRILRIEVWAEPLYVGSIIISGALRGAGDTLVPSIMNFVSLWAVRLPLSFLLAARFGLVGAWIAMSSELIFRGVIFLIRLWREKWLK